MVDSNVLVLDDSDHLSYVEDCLGQDIEQAIANLADPAQRTAALEALLLHPYAADDLLCSAAWPAFCGVLPSLLADTSAETAAAAVTFAGSVLRELRAGSPQQLAQLCMALAAAQAAHAGLFLATANTAVARPKQQGHQALQDIIGVPCSGMSRMRHSNAKDKAAQAPVGAALTRLLLASLQALPKVWESLRPPLMQALWDAICPLLRLPGSSSPPQQRAPAAHQRQPEAHGTQRTSSAKGTTDSRSFPFGMIPASAAGTGSTERLALADAALPAQRSGSGGPGPRPGMPPAPGALGPAACRVTVNEDEDRSPAPGPLAELCAAEENLGAWWRAWTAPAAACKWLPGSLERHGVLPGLLQKCRELAAQGSRGRAAGARPEEAFAVQVVGTVLLLSQGRRLFPVALAAAGGEPCMQVTVPCTVSWLIAIAARGSLVVEGERQPDLAACAAQDALHLLLRDDSEHARILSVHNVRGLLQLQATLQDLQPHCDTNLSSTRRRLEKMIHFLSRSAYGRQMVAHAKSAQLQAC